MWYIKTLVIPTFNSSLLILPKFFVALYSYSYRKETRDSVVCKLYDNDETFLLNGSRAFTVHQNNPTFPFHPSPKNNWEANSLSKFYNLAEKKKKCTGSHPVNIEIIFLERVSAFNMRIITFLYSVNVKGNNIYPFLYEKC